MRRRSQFSHILAPFIISLMIALGLVSCTSAVSPGSGPTPEPSPEAPVGVLRARDAVLAFVRTGAVECVPPKQAAWTATTEASPPDGYEVYRFASSGCVITITTPENGGANAVYHVALGDGPTGFCWQAVVDQNGRILLTGAAAQTDPTIGNPARKYCEAQGFVFEMVEQANGQKCGMCVFDENSSCNAWAYFHGACKPENTAP